MRKKIFAVLSTAAIALSLFAAAPAAKVKADEAAPIATIDFENGLEGLEVVPSHLEDSTAVPPEAVTDSQRGNVLYMPFGGNNNESALAFDNPYKGKDLEAVTFTAWVKVPASAEYMEYDELFGFNDGVSRLTLQTKPYLCWNAGATAVAENWIDWKSDTNAWLGFTPELLGPNYDTWQHYAVTIIGNDITLYLNGAMIAQNATGTGAGFGTDGALTMLEFLSQDTTNAYIGYGSFWGNQECWLDDVNFYDSALSADQIAEIVSLTKAASGDPVKYNFENGLNGFTVKPSTIEGSTVPAPEVVLDEEKGNVLKVAFGGSNDESALSFDNPFKGLSLDGVTMSAWVKVPATAEYMEYDELFGFNDGVSRLTFQTKPYICWNAGGAGVAENWIDWKSDTNAWLGFTSELLGPNYDTWQHYAVTITGNDITLYLNGVEIAQAATGTGAGFGTDGALTMLEFLSQDTTKAYIGHGSFWGSQECWLDDVSFYPSVLTLNEIIAEAGITTTGYPMGYPKEEAPVEEPETTEEEAAPTEVPTEAPTAAPTTAPVVTEASANADSGSSSNTTVIVIIVIAVACIACIAVVVLMNKKKKSGK